MSANERQSRPPSSGQEAVWEGKEWPQCGYFEEDCPAHVSAEKLSLPLYGALMRFLNEAEPGARLTLERAGGEFSLQITEPVRRSDGGPRSSGGGGRER